VFWILSRIEKQKPELKVATTKDIQRQKTNSQHKSSLFPSSFEIVLIDLLKQCDLIWVFLEIIFQLK